MLSIVGVDQVPDYGYYRPKVAQEKAVRNSDVPYGIARHPVLRVHRPSDGHDHRGHEGPPAVPAAAHDGLRRRRRRRRRRRGAALREPSYGVRVIAGPEVERLDRIGEITLAAKPDGHSIVTDEAASPFAGMPGGVLIGDDTAHLASTLDEDRLRQS
ncbi:hypothetical protein ACFV2N_36865 [Streptomyces sp. NPDC059680]|uniref:hypothetical protein n=1 Tax=Streptomyces sp. NPDC059680 TaxID=3346904 RepID=UPI003697099B